MRGGGGEREGSRGFSFFLFMGFFENMKNQWTCSLGKTHVCTKFCINFKGFYEPTDPRLGTPKIKTVCMATIWKKEEEEEGTRKKKEMKKKKGVRKMYQENNPEPGRNKKPFRLEHGSRISETGFESQLCSFPAV